MAAIVERTGRENLDVPYQYKRAPAERVTEYHLCLRRGHSPDTETVVFHGDSNRTRDVWKRCMYCECEFRTKLTTEERDVPVEGGAPN
jgi:hypothetical protein